MSDSESPLNPYAPSTVSDDSSEARRLALGVDEAGEHRQQTEPTASLGRTFARWLIVCSISAIPSFVFGMVVTDNEVGGMLVGILIFVAGYTWLDFITAKRPWRQNPRIRRMLRITYGTRIAISILFPIGGFLDVMCGTLTLTIISPFTDVIPGTNSLSFLGAMMTTLIQGCILNVVLGLYALLVYVIQTAIAAAIGSNAR